MRPIGSQLDSTTARDKLVGWTRPLKNKIVSQKFFKNIYNAKLNLPEEVSGCVDFCSVLVKCLVERAHGRIWESSADARHFEEYLSAVYGADEYLCCPFLEKIK